MGVPTSRKTTGLLQASRVNAAQTSDKPPKRSSPHTGGNPEGLPARGHFCRRQHRHGCRCDSMSPRRATRHARMRAPRPGADFSPGSRLRVFSERSSELTGT